jgi:hypothetical protein
MKQLFLNLSELHTLAGARKTEGITQETALYFEVEIEDEKAEEENTPNIMYKDILLAIRQEMYFELLSRIIALKVSSTEKYNDWVGAELIQFNCEVEDGPYYTQPVYSVQKYTINFDDTVPVLKN